MGYIVIDKKLQTSRNNNTARSHPLNSLQCVTSGAEGKSWRTHRSRDKVKGLRSGEYLPVDDCFTMEFGAPGSPATLNIYCGHQKEKKQWLDFLQLVVKRNIIERRKNPQNFVAN